MSIVQNELIAYGCINRPVNDTDLSGGGIDVTRRPFANPLSANSVIALVSDGVDARTVTVTGRKADGTSASEVITLNGTTEAVGVTVFERLESVDASSTDAARTITIRRGTGGATVDTILPNERGRFACFIGSSSDASAQKVRYEKLFFKNTNSSLALLNASVTLTADPSAKIRIGVGTVDGTAQAANRLTAPESVSFVDDNVAANLQGTNLASGAAVEVWIEQTLAAATAAGKSTFSLKLAGNTI